MLNSSPSLPGSGADAKWVFEDFAVGQSLRSPGRTIVDADLRLFIGATGHEHPAHTDAEYCKQHPIFSVPVAHGVLVLSITDAFIMHAITSKTTYSLNYGHDKIRYLAPVYPGDSIHAELHIVATEIKSADWGLISVQAETCNQRGEVVLVNLNKLMILRRDGVPAPPTGE